METLIDSVILAWALTHFACAIVKPDIVENHFGHEGKRLETIVSLLLVGTAMLAALTFDLLPLYIMLGVLEVSSCVASYTCRLVWNVSKANPVISAQLAMSAMQFLAAVCFLSKMLRRMET